LPLKKLLDVEEFFLMGNVNAQSLYSYGDGHFSGSRVNANLFLVLAAALKGDDAVDQGKQGVVTATTHIFTGMNFGAPLTNQNIASAYGFAAIALNAQALSG